MSPTWNINTWILAHAWQRLVVMRPADLQTLSLEDDAIERHSLRRLIHRAELKENNSLENIVNQLNHYIST